MSPTIRRAEARDVEALGKLHSAVWAELYTGVLSPEVLASLDQPTMAGLWTKFINRGEDYLQFVAEDDDRVVAFAGVGPGRDPGYELGRELYFIYVAPAYRRRGIGKQLMKTVRADYLWIAEDNRASQSFYRALKFFPDSVRRVGTLFGAELPEIRMAR